MALFISFDFDRIFALIFSPRLLASKCLNPLGCFHTHFCVHTHPQFGMLSNISLRQAHNSYMSSSLVPLIDTCHCMILVLRNFCCILTLIIFSHSGHLLTADLVSWKILSQHCYYGSNFSIENNPFLIVFFKATNAVHSFCRNQIFQCCFFPCFHIDSIQFSYFYQFPNFPFLLYLYHTEYP